MKTARSAIDPIARSRVNRRRVKPKISILAACLTALLFVSSGIADSKTFTSSSSESSTRIGSARVVKAIGGGSYVTGTTEPWFGYVPARIVHAHVAAYDHNGKLLAERPLRSTTTTSLDGIYAHDHALPTQCCFPTNPLKSPR